MSFLREGKKLTERKIKHSLFPWGSCMVKATNLDATTEVPSLYTESYVKYTNRNVKVEKRSILLLKIPIENQSRIKLKV